MTNMSYCRFHNTLLDLKDCLIHLYSERPLSPEEERARQRLIEVCQDIVNFAEDKDAWEQEYGYDEECRNLKECFCSILQMNQ